MPLLRFLRMSCDEQAFSTKVHLQQWHFQLSPGRMKRKMNINYSITLTTCNYMTRKHFAFVRFTSTDISFVCSHLFIHSVLFSRPASVTLNLTSYFSIFHSIRIQIIIGNSNYTILLTLIHFHANEQCAHSTSIQ